MRQYEHLTFTRLLGLSQKWLHLAIYLGFVAVDLGADKARIFRLIREGTKEEIDTLLDGRFRITEA